MFSRYVISDTCHDSWEVSIPLIQLQQHSKVFFFLSQKKDVQLFHRNEEVMFTIDFWMKIPLCSSHLFGECVTNKQQGKKVTLAWSACSPSLSCPVCFPWLSQLRNDCVAHTYHRPGRFSYCTHACYTFKSESNFLIYPTVVDRRRLLISNSNRLASYVDGPFIFLSPKYFLPTFFLDFPFSVKTEAVEYLSPSFQPVGPACTS